MAITILAELEKFARKMGFEKRMTEEALLDVALHIRDNLHQFHFEDLQLFLSHCAVGRYGKFYHGNTNELMGMWEQYAEARAAHAMAEGRKRGAKNKADQDRVADEVQAIHKGYKRVRREQINADRAKADKRRRFKAQVELKRKCTSDAASLWSAAMRYAKGRKPEMQELDFAEKLLPNEIAAVLYRVRQHKLNAGVADRSH